MLVLPYNYEVRKQKYLSLIDPLRTLVESHGYILATMGSMQNDLDIVIIPWEEEFAQRLDLLGAICKEVDGRVIRQKRRLWGREQYWILFGEPGEDYILDISLFYPV